MLRGRSADSQERFKSLQGLARSQRAEIDACKKEIEELKSEIATLQKAAEQPAQPQESTQEGAGQTEAAAAVSLLSRKAFLIRVTS